MTTRPTKVKGKHRAPNEFRYAAFGVQVRRSQKLRMLLTHRKLAFDKAARAKRTGVGSDAATSSARTAWMNAQDYLDRQRSQLRKIEAQSGTPLPTQVEGQLNVARNELRVAIAELEKLTIRAPIASTVLKVNVKVGELAAPASPQPLLLLSDLSRLRVRAELDEHNIGKAPVCLLACRDFGSWINCARRRLPI